MEELEENQVPNEETQDNVEETSLEIPDYEEVPIDDIVYIKPAYKKPSPVFYAVAAAFIIVVIVIVAVLIGRLNDSTNRINDLINIINNNNKEITELQNQVNEQVDYIAEIVDYSNSVKAVAEQYELAFYPHHFFNFEDLSAFYESLDETELRGVTSSVDRAYIIQVRAAQSGYILNACLYNGAVYLVAEVDDGNFYIINPSTGETQLFAYTSTPLKFYPVENINPLVEK